METYNALTIIVGDSTTQKRNANGDHNALRAFNAVYIVTTGRCSTPVKSCLLFIELSIWILSIVLSPRAPTTTTTGNSTGNTVLILISQNTHLILKKMG